MQWLTRNTLGVSITGAAIPLTCLLVACSPEVPKEICVGLNETIDRNIKGIALSDIEGDSADKSAMQQGARLAQNNNRLTTIMINLELQAQNKCPPRQKPIDSSIYSSQAQHCYIEILEQQSANYGSDEERKKTAMAKVMSACDFNAWNVQVTK